MASVRRGAWRRWGGGGGGDRWCGKCGVGLLWGIVCRMLCRTATGLLVLARGLWMVADTTGFQQRRRAVFRFMCTVFVTPQLRLTVDIGFRNQHVSLYSIPLLGPLLQAQRGAGTTRSPASFAC